MGSANIEALSELFHCERWCPVRKGWSSDHLLPTDKNAFRLKNCTTTTWASVADAEAALLARGWRWEQPQPVGNDPAVEIFMGWRVSLVEGGEGWFYSTNFNAAFEDGLDHESNFPRVTLVRWRRLTRSQTFAEEELLARPRSASGGFHCPHVDLEAAERLSKRILETLAVASLIQNDYSIPQLVRLKRKLAECLLATERSTHTSPDCLLQEFISKERTITIRLKEVFRGDEPEAVRRRMGELEQHFKPQERQAVAACALRLHCPELVCGYSRVAMDTFVADAENENVEDHVCKYRPVACPHRGCKVTVSAYKIETHDAICKYCPVACGACGEQIPRGEHATHNSSFCPKRPATCPFLPMGCCADLTHEQIPKHLDDHYQAHLLQHVRVTIEQDEKIKSLQAQVTEAETKIKSLEGEKDKVLKLTKQVADLESKLSKSTEETTKKVTEIANGSKQDVLDGANGLKARVDAQGKWQMQKADDLKEILERLARLEGGLRASGA